MLLDRLSAWSDQSPDSVAVVAGRESLSYRDLDSTSRRVAAFLRAAGVEPSAIVAVYGRRTTGMIAAMLGVLRAGMAYTIVEDDGQEAENRERLMTMSPRLVLCEGDRAEALTGAGLAVASWASAFTFQGSAAPSAFDPSETAYVLFTSGSTGKPKGVAVSHANIAHYTQSLISRLHITERMRYAHVSTLAADLGNTSVFLALWTGGTLHLIDPDTRKDSARLLRYLGEAAIDFLKITPSHWRAIAGGLKRQIRPKLHLKYLVLGGEPLPVALAREVLESKVVDNLVNHYGPTETTVGVTVYPLRTLEQLQSLRSDNVPIGLPLGATVLRVRTEDGRFLDRGAHGELYIGGPSVAIGYVGDQLGTARSFVSLDTMERSS